MNLVTNGTFDTDLTGWTPSFEEEITVVAGRCRFRSKNWDDGDPVYLSQEIPSLQAVEYTVSFDASIPTAFAGHSTGIRVSLGFSDDGPAGNDETLNKTLIPNNAGVLTHYDIPLTVTIDDGVGGFDRNLYLVAVGEPFDINIDPELGSPILIDNVSILVNTKNYLYQTIA